MTGSAAGPNEAQADYWEERSSSWIAAEGYTARVGGPFGRAAIDRLDPRPGWTVLDVGCGTGPTTVELARRVAPGGEVRGVDIAPTMIDAARSRAMADGVGNVDFRVADAQTHELGEGAFDGVFSQFGVMFFAQPDAAFANLRRCLRPGGRLSFVCWQDLFANEWMFVPGAAAISVTGEVPPMPAPGAPGPFAFADPGRIEAILTGAGFTGIEIEPSSGQVVVPADQVDLAVESASQVGAVREALESQGDGPTRTRILAAVREALVERIVDGEVRLSSAAHLVAATAP
jgi:SAM-dependent methyltransferase